MSTRTTINCPLCFARTSVEPEKDALYCKACRTDIKPYIEAFLEYTQASYEAKVTEEKTE